MSHSTQYRSFRLSAYRSCPPPRMKNTGHALYSDVSHLVQDDVDDGLSVPPVDVLNEGPRGLTEPRTSHVGGGAPNVGPGRGGCGLADREPDQQADVGEDGPGGRRRLAAVPHRAAQVVGDDAAVVDRRTERGQIARRGCRDRRRRVDDSFNWNLSIRDAASATQSNQSPCCIAPRFASSSHGARRPLYIQRFAGFFHRF